MRLLAIACTGALVFAACGGDDDDADVGSPSDGTETTAPSDDTETTAEPSDDTEASAAPSKPDTTAAPAGDVEPWRRTAQQVDFGAATVATVECPPDGTAYRVWGTEIYTDDSSICTAAVHAGLIDLDDGGTVEVERTPGEDSYEGTDANGVTTDSYGAWGGSFVFTD